MKLHIDNFAAISTADILFDGMTVVAGNNNTGKSTVGKVLYAFFRSLSNLDKRIQAERIESMRAAFNVVPGIDVYGDVMASLLNGEKPETIVKNILHAFWQKGEKIGVSFPSEKEASIVIETYFHAVKAELEQAQRTSDVDYGRRILLRVFDCVFHKQYHPLQPSDGISRLTLTVKGQDNFLEFGHSSWSYDCPTKLIKKARLIATPDILSLVNIPNIESDKRASVYFEKYTYEILKELREESPLSVAQQIASREQLNLILQNLDEVIGGAFKRDEQNDFSLYENAHTRPTKAANLSMGLKAFVLLRLMLENGVLSQDDVLILDEPENHLHPEWQVRYAQLLVLFQKTFHLTMMVTSHSNFFVNALQRFCISEGILNNTHFYLSQPDNKRPGFYTFEDMKTSSGALIRSFNKAYDEIDAITGGDA